MTRHVLADIFPASINPVPEGVPHNLKLRVVIAEEELVVMWGGGGNVQVSEWRQELSPGSTARVSYRGGMVGGFNVTKGTGCSCGSSSLKNWNPFKGQSIEVVQRRMIPDSTTPVTYSRN